MRGDGYDESRTVDCPNGCGEYTIDVAYSCGSWWDRDPYCPTCGAHYDDAPPDEVDDPDEDELAAQAGKQVAA